MSYESFNYFRDWDDFLNKNTVVYFPSKEKYIEFMKFLDERGICWNGGSRVFRDNGDPYMSIINDCIACNPPRHGLSHAGANHYLEDGKKVVQFNGFT